MAISSHVIVGRVGLRAIAPVFEAFGIDCDLLPTVLLSWHPGMGKATRVETEDFEKILADCSNNMLGNKMDAILTGYFASLSQVQAAAEFIRVQKQLNPELIYVCDPVCGDNGRFYVEREIAIGIRDELLPLADVITPNIFELSWLSDHATDSLEEVMEASVAASPNACEVLVSSAPTEEDDLTALVLTNTPGWSEVKHSEEPVIAVQVMKHRRFDAAPNGTGDLLSAVYLALRLLGDDLEEALSGSTFVIHEMVALAHHYLSDELPIAQALAPIIAELTQKREADVSLGYYDEEFDDEFEVDDDPPPPSKLH